MSPARPVPHIWAGALVGSNNSETKLSKAQREAEADNGILAGRGLHMVFILQWVGLLTGMKLWLTVCLTSPPDALRGEVESDIAPCAALTAAHARIPWNVRTVYKHFFGTQMEK